MNLSAQQMRMVVVLVIGAFLVVLNQTLLTPAYPTIMEHLSVNATTVQWLTSGYSLVEAVIIPLNAYLLGRFPSRRLILGGLGLFVVGSLVCATAPVFPMLLLGRVLQACATGVVMPSVFAIILMIFPVDNRGTAMGVIGLVIAFAPAVGPSLSGVLVDSIGWRALFFLVAGCALLLLFAAILFVKSTEGFAPAHFDLPSVVLLALGMVTLLYGLSTFTSTDSPLVSFALMAVGVTILFGFAKRQGRLAEPVLKVATLEYRQFRTAAILILFLEAVLVGTGVIVPMYLQNAMGESATLSGLIMLPGAVVGAVCGLGAGIIFDHRGVRGITLAGAGILLVGAIGYATLSTSSSVPMICLVYSIACIGSQLLITPLNTWGINSLPKPEIAHGNAIVSTFEQVGASLGTAFVVSLTAVPALIGQVASSVAEQAAAGCHWAFFGIIALVTVTALGIALFAKDE